MFEQQSGDFTIESMIFTNIHRAGLTKKKEKNARARRYNISGYGRKLFACVSQLENLKELHLMVIFVDLQGLLQTNTGKGCMLSEEEVESLDLLKCQSLKSLSVSVHGKGKKFLKRIGEIAGRLDIESLTLEVLLCHSCN